jgi:hypothetical protein
MLATSVYCLGTNELIVLAQRLPHLAEVDGAGDVGFSGDARKSQSSLIFFYTYLSDFKIAAKH